MKTVPLFGNGIAGRSLPLTAQRRLNVYLENRVDGDKTKVAFIGTPGLVYQFALDYTARCLFGSNTTLYAVAGQYFYALSPSGSTLFSGEINTYSGHVEMSASPSQIMVVDGVNGWIYASGSFTQITSPGFPAGAKTTTFVGGYFVAEQPGTQQFWVSNAYDGTTWNALAFASASQYPDTLVAVDSLTGNLILFSELHTEFWQNVGATPEPFQPILAATTEFGLAALGSRAHLSNSIFFLAQNPQGSIQVAVVNGYQIQVVSTPDLDYIMSQFTRTDDAQGIGYQIDNHAMYQLTFPTDNRTFLYDMTTGIWSEMQTGVTQDYATRHQANLCAQVGGVTYVSDWENGNIYWFSELAFTDNGTPILRQLTTRHASSNFNVFGIDELYFDMDTGVGLQSGQGSDPQIMIACSKDNGRTYSTDRYMSLGAVGSYLTRVITRQWGSARDFVFRIQMTDPVKFILNDGAVTIRDKPQ